MYLKKDLEEYRDELEQKKQALDEEKQKAIDEAIEEIERNFANVKAEIDGGIKAVNELIGKFQSENGPDRKDVLE